MPDTSVNSEIPLDAIDLALLNHLQTDSSPSNLALAEAVYGLVLMRGLVFSERRQTLFL